MIVPPFVSKGGMMRSTILLLRRDRDCQIVRRTALPSLLVHRRHEIRVHVVVLDRRVHIELDRCYGRCHRSDGFDECEGLRIGDDRPGDVRGPINVERADLAKVRLLNLAWEAPRQRDSLGYHKARCGRAQSASGIRRTTNGDRVCTNDASGRTDG